MSIFERTSPRAGTGIRLAWVSVKLFRRAFTTAIYSGFPLLIEVQSAAQLVVFPALSASFSDLPRSVVPTHFIRKTATLEIGPRSRTAQQMSLRIQIEFGRGGIRMNCRSIRGISRLAFVLILFASPALSFAQENQQPHWAYSGPDDPKHWGKLDPAYAECAVGHLQSPVNITHAKPADLPALKID